MKKQFLLKTMFLLCALVVGSSMSWAEDKTVTYEISSHSTLTIKGTAPTGSSATIKETYGTSLQMTSGNSQTLTLSGFNGCTIKKLELSMRSNSSGGAGKLSYSTDAGTNYSYIVGTSTSGVAFNKADWYGAWSTSYVSITKDNLNITCGTSNVIFKIEATANSLYCKEYSITYEESAPATICDTPTFTPASGSAVTYGSEITITSTDGATIYYTTDGSNPTTGSSVYDPDNKPTITAATTIKAIAVKDGLDDSEVGSASYTIQAPAAPTFSPAGGTVGKGSTVTLSSAEGTTIRYTTDGTEPSATVGTIYSDPIVINEDVTIKAVAYDAGNNPSSVASYTFTAFDGTVVTFDASSDSGTSPLSKDGVSFACSNGALNNNSDYRLYKNSITTISVSSGIIKRIEFICTSSNPASGFGTLSGFSTDGDNGVWSGSAKSVSFTASGAQVRATEIKVFLVSLKPTTMSIEPAFENGFDVYTATGGSIVCTVKSNDVALSPQPTISYSSSDEKVATINEDGMVTFIKAGTTTLTASFEGDDEYEACEATYDLTLFDTNPQKTTVNIGFNNNLYGTSFTGAGAAGDGPVSGSVDNVTVEANQGTSNNFYISDSETRIYSGGTITITAPAGYTMTNIIFNSGTAPSRWDVSASVGTLSSVTWTGSASDVVFSASDRSDFKTATITLAPTVTISDTKYAAYCPAHKLDFTDSDVKAYKASVDNTTGKVTLTKVDVVPAGTGVVLYCETSGEYAIPVTTKAASDVTGNEMVGVLTRTQVLWNPETDVYNYILQQGQFKKASTGYLKPNLAYLSTSYDVTAPGARELEIVFDDDITTGVEGLKNSNTEELKSYYNLNGQRMAQPTKGLYIVNGRKVVIK